MAEILANIDRVSPARRCARCSTLVHLDERGRKIVPGPAAGRVRVPVDEPGGAQARPLVGLPGGPVDPPSSRPGRGPSWRWCATTRPSARWCSPGPAASSSTARTSRCCPSARGTAPRSWRGAVRCCSTGTPTSSWTCRCPLRGTGSCTSAAACRSGRSDSTPRPARGRVPAGGARRGLARRGAGAGRRLAPGGSGAPVADRTAAPRPRRPARPCRTTWPARRPSSGPAVGTTPRGLLAPARRPHLRAWTRRSSTAWPRWAARHDVVVGVREDRRRQPGQLDLRAAAGGRRRRRSTDRAARARRCCGWPMPWSPTTPRRPSTSC